MEVFQGPLPLQNMYLEKNVRSLLFESFYASWFVPVTLLTMHFSIGSCMKTKNAHKWIVRV